MIKHEEVAPCFVADKDSDARIQMAREAQA
jgi:hypothetical protein